MMKATSKMSMSEITDICGHGADNCLTCGPFQIRDLARMETKSIVIQGYACLGRACQTNEEKNALSRQKHGTSKDRHPCRRAQAPDNVCCKRIPDQPQSAGIKAPLPLPFHGSNNRPVRQARRNLIS